MVVYDTFKDTSNTWSKNEQPMDALPSTFLNTVDHLSKIWHVSDQWSIHAKGAVTFEKWPLWFLAGLKFCFCLHFTATKVFAFVYILPLQRFVVPYQCLWLGWNWKCKKCRLSDFQFQLLHQMAPFKYHCTFCIYWQLVKTKRAIQIFERWCINRI